LRFINKDVPRSLWPVRRQSLDLTPQGCRVPTISPGRLAEACSFLVRLHVRQVESIWKNDCLCRLLRLQVTPANGGHCPDMTQGPAAPKVAKFGWWPVRLQLQAWRRSCQKMGTWNTIATRLQTIHFDRWANGGGSSPALWQYPIIHIRSVWYTPRSNGLSFCKSSTNGASFSISSVLTNTACSILLTGKRLCSAYSGVTVIITAFKISIFC